MFLGKVYVAERHSLKENQLSLWPTEAPVWGPLSPSASHGVPLPSGVQALRVSSQNIVWVVGETTGAGFGGPVRD